MYYGLQTVIFEVGLAYLIARYAVSRDKLTGDGTEAFGLGLGFWENAVLLSLLSLVNLIIYYAILSTNTSIAQTLFDQLSKNAPSLFYTQSQAIRLVAAGIVERFSSIMVHFSWGYLCLLAAFFHKHKYFALALPMGFIDFLVPFAPTLGIIVFEGLVFILSAASLATSILATRELRKNKRNDNVLSSIS